VIGLFGEAAPQVLPHLASLLKLDLSERYADISRYLDAEALQRQIYMASRRFFEKLAQATPVVLVFEDLHYLSGRVVPGCIRLHQAKESVPHGS